MKVTQHNSQLAAVLAILASAENLEHTFSVDPVEGGDSSIDEDMHRAGVISTLTQPLGDVHDYGISGGGEAHLGSVRVYISTKGEVMGAVAVHYF